MQPTKANGEEPKAAYIADAQKWMREGRVLLGRTLGFAQRQVNQALGHASAAMPDGPLGGFCGLAARLPLTAEQVLLAYAQGMYLEDKAGTIRWRNPEPRSVVPLDALRVPSRIRTYLRKGLFELTFDQAPSAVLAACGQRPDTWLTPRVQAAFERLFAMGAMHTVEAWNNQQLVGGLFGIAVGQVFTVESMFSHESHASKLAFALLGQRLREQGFRAIDCQLQQDHFARFGAVEISRSAYRNMLASGLANPAQFPTEAGGRVEAHPVKPRVPEAEPPGSKGRPNAPTPATVDSTRRAAG